ncbi:MAG: divergent PAP2 family protein [Candidatus Omnitrophica bacterium]|nr:divergent PAP2 family protein [Candidatus Omnitrophota bacterium]
MLHNRIFITTLIAWVIAQSIKVAVGVVREKRFDFKWFIGTGGMPSSHSAGVTALATSVGLIHGFYSAIFAITAIFTLIIMFDAQGVRRATGEQAEILNKIMDDIYHGKQVREDRLKELIGHTPVEVLIGGLLGILVAIICIRG